MSIWHENVTGRMECVYRAYDAEGVLLYIGQTCDFEERRTQHMANSIWRNQVVRWRVRWYMSMFRARRAEAQAIREEHPRWNIQHRSRNHPEGFVRSVYELAPLFPDNLSRPLSRAVADRYHGRLDAYFGDTA